MYLLAGCGGGCDSWCADADYDVVDDKSQRQIYRHPQLSQFSNVAAAVAPALAVVVRVDDVHSGCRASRLH